MQSQKLAHVGVLALLAGSMVQSFFALLSFHTIQAISLIGIVLALHLYHIGVNAFMCLVFRYRIEQFEEDAPKLMRPFELIIRFFSKK
jgi:uncharacterized YccA/Bax inhibitor family protein